MPSGEHESHEARGNARPREMAVVHRIRLTGVLRAIPGATHRGYNRVVAKV